jgi:hypothetical protein
VSVTKLAALIGWTQDKLTNHLLAETLEEFPGPFPNGVRLRYRQERPVGFDGAGQPRWMQELNEPGILERDWRIENGLWCG